MIKSLKRTGLAAYFNTGSHRKLQAKHAARLKLSFHPLKGKPKRWAVSVDENFRVIFRFEDGHALEVDYDDYH